MASSLKKLAIRGTLWTVFSYGLSNVLRLAGNIVLSRLLFPELFGLISTVNIFITGLSLFSDVGIGPSIIQNKRGDDPQFLNTAWTIQVIRGFCLWVGCLLIAFPVSLLYKEPRLVWLLPIVGLTTVISGFNSTALFTLNREIALGRLVAFELGSQVITLSLIIVWAYLNPTVWAIVVGMLASSVIRLFWSHQLIQNQKRRIFSNAFRWDRKAADNIFSFGKWIFVSTALTFLAEQSDKLLLGWLISAKLGAATAFTVLGVYNVAYIMGDIPRHLLNALSSKVLFPVFSKVSDQPRPIFRDKIRRSRRPFLLVGTLALIGLATFGDRIIFLLYDDRYRQAAWMLPVLALGFWPRVLTQTIDQSLFAIGKSRYVAFGSFSKFMYMLAVLPASFYFFGLPGAIFAIAFNDLPFYAAVLYGLWRENLECFLQDVYTTLLAFGLLVIVLLTRYSLGFGLPFDTLFHGI